MGYSLNGIEWYGLGNTIFSVEANSVAYNGSKWVAVGKGEANTIATSDDGFVWTGQGKVIFTESATELFGLRING